ncbi:MAG: hypothetical protein AAB558_00915 [Patescibacteria group bacterium]
MKESRRLARVGMAALGLAAAGAPGQAEAGITHKKPGMETHQIADVVAPVDHETRKLMEKWGIDFNGREIRLKLDPRDDGRPLVAGEPNAVVQVSHVGNDKVVFRFVERDGGVGSVSIVRGYEAGSFEFDLNVSQGHPRSGSVEQGLGKHTYGEYGKVRVFGMHTHKPPSDPGMKWYYHNPKGEEKEGWWYQAREGSR